MRKLNLKSYQWTQKVVVKDKEGEHIQDVTSPFNVKDSVVNIMFMPGLGLKGAELIKQNILAVKIEQAEDEVMLEEAEYERIVTAANNYTAISRADVEFIDRILNQTPQIE